LELKYYFMMLRRWGWIMLLCMVTAGVASYWFSSQQPRVYQSRARYLVGPAINHPNVSLNDLRASSQVGKTYAELATSRPIIQDMIDKLQLNTDVDTIAEHVTATWLDATQILNIQVRATDPQTAAVIANSLGDVIIERSPSGPSSVQAARRQEATLEIERLKQSIRAMETEITQLYDQVQQTTDELAQRVLLARLDQRRAQLVTAQKDLADQYAIVQNSSTNQISVMEPAVAEAAPIAPDINRNVMVALIAGLVLGLGAMLLSEYFTNVIYTPEDLRTATGLTYLGGIVRHKKLRGRDTSQLVVQARPDTSAAESYRILRTNLPMTGSEGHLSSLLVTSPAQGDGKSEVAANLAVSFAQAGKQVILIDANLRRPGIADLFGLPDDVGLSSLLEKRDQVLEPLPIESIPGLSVLPAGASTPNSSEILGSQHMYRLIQEFKARADLIVLDSPPLLSSDALALARQVDGTLLVVNRGTTDRENTIKAIESLRLVGAHLVGVVLNRVKPGPAYSYYPSYVPNRQAVAFARTAMAPVGHTANGDEPTFDHDGVGTQPEDNKDGS
jgi:succinoglycan biosynthesis transport protein ExoP